METHLEIIEELIESDKATLTAVDKMFLGSVLWLIVFFINDLPTYRKICTYIVTVLVLKCQRTMGTSRGYQHTGV